MNGMLMLECIIARLGGDIVLTEKEVRATKLFKSGEVPRPILGLNCVGGESSTEMCKILGMKIVDDP